MSCLITVITERVYSLLLFTAYSSTIMGFHGSATPGEVERSEQPEVTRVTRVVGRRAPLLSEKYFLKKYIVLVHQVLHMLKGSQNIHLTSLINNILFRP